MKLFHRLIYSPQQGGLQRVVAYDLCGFDSTVFWQGKPYNDPLPEDMTLWISDGQASDYLANPLSWPICSEGLLAILKKRATDDVQILSAPAKGIVDERTIKIYNIVNVLTMIDCLDHAESDITFMTIQGKRLPCVNRFVVRADAIPSRVHIFRIPESPSAVIISDDLAQDMIGRALVGVALIRTRGV